MSALQRGKRSRGIVGRFAALPHAFFCTPEFAALSGRAVKLLIALELTYDGKNNGDLAITRAGMLRRGFRSADQLYKARDELINAGWILLTRHGGLNAPSLYALSYRAIDRCDGKIDVKPGPAPHLWMRDKAHARETRGEEPKRRPRPTKKPVPYNGTRRSVQRDTAVPYNGTGKAPSLRTTEQSEPIRRKRCSVVRDPL